MRLTDETWSQIQEARKEFNESLADLIEAAKRKIAAGEIVPERIVEELASIACLPTELAIKARHVLHAKVKTLELLGRYLKMWSDQKEEKNEESDLFPRLQKALDFVAAQAKSRRM